MNKKNIFLLIQQNKKTKTLRLKEHLKIADSKKLDFANINLLKDNKLFANTRLIEKSTNPLLMEMKEHLSVFWGKAFKFVKKNDKNGFIKLLKGIKEPNETFTGFSSKKINGNSVGKKLIKQFADSIFEKSKKERTFFNNFSDLELFLKGYGSDRISDITICVIKNCLIEFTQKECEKIGSVPLKNFTIKNIFNKKTKKWESKEVKLPYYNEKPIIFLPKIILSGKSNCNNTLASFYRFAIANFLMEDTEILKNIKGSGKDNKIFGKDLKEIYKLNKVDLLNWCLKYSKLLVDFKSQKISNYTKCLTDNEIEKITQ